MLQRSPHVMAGKRVKSAMRARGWTLADLTAAIPPDETGKRLSLRTCCTLQQGKGNVCNYQRACEALGLATGLAEGNPPGRHVRLATWGDPPVTGSLRTCPLTRMKANDLVRRLHRSHRPKKQSFVFAIGLEDEHGILHGAVIGSIPASKSENGKRILELSRVVVREDVPNGCSILITAATRTATEWGYQRCQTFLLEHENAASLKASGWRFECWTKPSNWANRPGRTHDNPGRKQKWVKDLQPKTYKSEAKSR